MGAIASMAGNIGGSLSGVLSGVTGFFQRKKGNRLLQDNPFPTEAMPSEVLANQQMAQGVANQGLSSEEYQRTQRTIERNQLASMAALGTQPGALVRNIGAVQQQSNDSTLGLAAQSEQVRRANRAELYNANQQVANWKDKLFDWNQRAKFEMNRNYAMSLIGAGNANLMAGADKLIGSAVGGASSGLFSGGGGKASGGPSATAASAPGLADPGGPVYSPAAGYPSINPNQYLNLIGG